MFALRQGMIVLESEQHLENIKNRVRNETIDEVINALNEYRGNQLYLIQENIFELLEQMKK